MIEALVVSSLVLWVAVVALTFMVYALVRQVGVLHERLAPAGALAAATGPAVGETSPEITVPALAGGTVTVGGLAAEGLSTLLFFLSPTCPVCETLLPTVLRIAGEEGLRLVLASDGPAAEHQAFVTANDLSRYPYVLSRDLGLAFEVAKLPYAVLIDAAGVVCAKGLVNTREHVESLFTAREYGVASIQEYIRKQGSARSADRHRSGALR